jgi:predicted nucleic acid-binding protein
MRPIVADSSPLIALARINRLDLLEQLFGQIIIPPTVVHELTLKGRRKKGVAALRAAPWIVVRDLTSAHSLGIVSATLDAGERAAIALAHEQGHPLLVDELAGRREADRLGLEVYGTLAVLLEAKVKGLIPAVKPLLDALQGEDFWLSPTLIHDTLRQAHEA